MTMSFALIALAALGASLAQAQPAPPPAGPAPTPVPRTAFLATMDAEFARMDADRNGTATRAEVEASLRAAAAAQHQARLSAMFARLDTDRSGQVSAAEFARFPAPAAAVNAAPLLAQADLNKDQSITLVEYRTAKLANFDRLDTDKDGVASVAEMRAAGIVK